MSQQRRHLNCLIKKIETNILYLKILNLYFNITIISQRKDKFNSVYYICYQSVIFITFFVTKNYLLDSMFDSNLSFSDSLSFTNKVRALTFGYRSNPREVFLEKGVPKIYSKFTGELALQLYQNHTSEWVFPCKFAAYTQNNFS